MKKESISYRELRSKLDEVLAALEASELDIDEAIALHKKGQQIVAQMESYLNDVGKTVKKHSKT
jgi:exodeoxyribonuclease VII small subunit